MTLANNAKKKLYANLLAKLNSGKTLTANERTQLDELGEIFGEHEKAPEKNSNPLDVSRPVVSAFFSVTPQTIANWCDKGMPKLSRGLYNLKECFQWWQRVIDGGGSEDMDEHKTRYWKEMADGKEIDNNVLRGSLISRNDVIHAWVWRVADLRTGLYSWSSRLPPVLEGKNAIELRISLRDAVDELLAAFERDGQFTPKKASSDRKQAKKRRAKRK